MSSLRADLRNACEKSRHEQHDLADQIDEGLRVARATEGEHANACGHGTPGCRLRNVGLRRGSRELEQIRELAR